MEVLSAHEAWTILGKDSKKVLQRLASIPRAQRVEAAEQDLEEAKKIAKKLRGVHHPDRGGDTEIFKRIGAALEALEYHTEEFKRKMKLFEDQSAEKESRRVFIRLGE